MLLPLLIVSFLLQRLPLPLPKLTLLPCEFRRHAEGSLAFPLDGLRIGNPADASQSRLSDFSIADDSGHCAKTSEVLERVSISSRSSAAACFSSNSAKSEHSDQSL